MVTPKDGNRVSSEHVQPQLRPFERITYAVGESFRKLLREHNKVFLFLTGLPGSGKTTFVQSFLSGFPSVSFDRLVVSLFQNRRDSESYVKDANLTIVNQMEQKIRHELAAEKHLVVFEEAVIGLSMFRGHFLFLGKLHGFRTVFVYFPIDWDTALQRNAQRSLDMSDEGQMRMPHVLLKTIHDHQNTSFKIADRSKDFRNKDHGHVSFLATQLSAHEQTVVNGAFFRMITIDPANEPFKRHLKRYDCCDELWTVSDDDLRIEKI